MPSSLPGHADGHPQMACLMFACMAARPVVVFTSRTRRSLVISPPRLQTAVTPSTASPNAICAMHISLYRSRNTDWSVGDLKLFFLSDLRSLSFCRRLLPAKS